MLANKIPPLVVMMGCAVLMYGLAQLPFGQVMLPRLVWLAAMFALLGSVVLAAGLWAFDRAKTTVNPLAPEQAAHIVQTGVYARTRNPMYVGMACYLVAWAIWLAQPWTVLGVMVFVLYITHFQIIPEERVLAQKFGAEYTDYCRRVRRWI